MRVILTGASGFVGRHLLIRLQREGHEVFVVSRREARAFGSHIVDSVDRALDGWPARVDVVVHLAARIPRGGQQDEATTFEANVEGTRVLAAKALAEGVGRIVFVSTTSVHGSGKHGLIVETDAVAPANLYSRSKAAAEQVFWDVLGADRSQGVVIRPVPIFGPGGHGPVALLGKLARLPVPLPLASLGAPRSVISIDSVTDILVRCLDAPTVAGETFLIADDGPVRAEDIVRALRVGWRRAPLLFAVPPRLLGTAARLSGKQGRWDDLTLPFIVDATKIKEKLQWKPAFSAVVSIENMAGRGLL